MTVNYSQQAATATFYNFTCLLIKWKGSVWKLVFIEAMIWSVLYFFFQIVYCLVLHGTWYGAQFEQLIRDAKERESSTLLTILLGFFTSITITRWWTIYELMEWPDCLASTIATHLNLIRGIAPEEMRRIRRTCARYIMLSYIFLMRDISEPVKRRFPDYETIGPEMITNEELAAIKDMITKGHTTCKYAIPLHWMTWMLKKIYYENEPSKTADVKYQKQSAINRHQYVQIVNTVFTFRNYLGKVIAYDWIPNPILAYTQVSLPLVDKAGFKACILTVYGYLVQQLVSRQVIYGYGHGWNLAFTFLIALAENMCYLGWFKAAQVMINPFGYDDEDFEVMWLIDRHWSVVKKVLEDPWLKTDLPNDIRNNGFNQVNRLEDLPLPHTLVSAGDMLINRSRAVNNQGAMANLHVLPAEEENYAYLVENEYL